MPDTQTTEDKQTKTTQGGPLPYALPLPCLANKATKKDKDETPQALDRQGRPCQG